MTGSTNTGHSSADTLTLVSVIDLDIVARAFVIAFVIGSTLTLTNQFGAIFERGEFNYLQLALAYITPFIVITISQILGIHRAMIDTVKREGPKLSGESFLTTTLTHGIPFRALLVGVLVGSLNASIYIMIAIREDANMNSLPVVSLALAYILPIVFGLLSQTIAYRRAFQGVRSGRQQRGSSMRQLLVIERNSSCVR